MVGRPVLWPTEARRSARPCTDARPPMLSMMAKHSSDSALRSLTSFGTATSLMREVWNIPTCIPPTCSGASSTRVAAEGRLPFRT